WATWADEPCSCSIRTISSSQRGNTVAWCPRALARRVPARIVRCVVSALSKSRLVAWMTRGSGSEELGGWRAGGVDSCAGLPAAPARVAVISELPRRPGPLRSAEDGPGAGRIRDPGCAGTSAGIFRRGNCLAGSRADEEQPPDDRQVLAR